ncbi:MAG: YhcH/YjgK/YiaL family protein [Victivallales bacterium]|nr:YhcH/YjgK/YiaL family protein [Victivallales bacterium]
MIIDRLANWRLYANVNPLFQKAFEFLEKSDLSGMECGRYDIAGDDAYAMIQEPEGKTEATAKVEVHRKYIDIQFVVSGNEKMGWIPLCGMGHDEGFDEKKDCGFFKDKAQSWFDVRPGCFAIFFPEDGHAPNVGTGVHRKVVIKVKA